ncbi:MAG: hypothetical protein ABIE74_06905 [Pseudomonadota bacterium]
MSIRRIQHPLLIGHPNPTVFPVETSLGDGITPMDLSGDHYDLNNVAYVIEGPIAANIPIRPETHKIRSIPIPLSSKQSLILREHEPYLKRYDLFSNLNYSPVEGSFYFGAPLHENDEGLTSVRVSRSAIGSDDHSVVFDTEIGIRDIIECYSLNQIPCGERFPSIYSADGQRRAHYIHTPLLRLFDPATAPSIGLFLLLEGTIKKPQPTNERMVSSKLHLAPDWKMFKKEDGYTAIISALRYHPYLLPDYFDPVRTNLAVLSKGKELDLAGSVNRFGFSQLCELDATLILSCNKEGALTLYSKHPPDGGRRIIVRSKSWTIDFQKEHNCCPIDESSTITFAFLGKNSTPFVGQITIELLFPRMQQQTSEDDKMKQHPWVIETEDVLFGKKNRALLLQLASSQHLYGYDKNVPPALIF